MSEIHQTTRIRIDIHNVRYDASLHTDFAPALTQFLHDQGLITPDVRVEMAIEPPTPGDGSAT